MPALLLVLKIMMDLMCLMDLVGLGWGPLGVDGVGRLVGPLGLAAPGLGGMGRAGLGGMGLGGSVIGLLGVGLAEINVR